MLRDPAVDLYILSQAPEFGVLQDLLMRVAADYYADFPRKPEDIPAYDTCNAVSNTIRLIIRRLAEEIEVGKRLSLPDESGGESDADDGHNERTRA